MSKQKRLDKSEARQRRNQMLDNAAASKLSLTEGVREMRAISGMTQEDFARHRGVSARVIKALELGQGNPTVATLNRIGEFFGLQVGFVPIHPTEQQKSEVPPSATLAQSDELMRAIAELQRSMQEQVELTRQQHQAFLNSVNKKR